MEKTTKQIGHTPKGAAFTELILEVFALNGLLIAEGDRLTAPFGLTSARWQVLGALALSDRPLTVAQIARRMGLKRQSVQRLVNILLAQGLLTAKDNPDHKRAKSIELTDTGFEIYNQLNQIQVAWANQYVEKIDLKALEIAVAVLDQLLKHSE